MNRIRWYGPTLALLVTALLVMVTGPGLVRQIAHAHQAESIQLVKDELAQAPSLAMMNESFRRVAEVVSPSVVRIDTFTKRDQRMSRFRGGRDMLREWFERGDLGQLMPFMTPDDDGQSPQKSDEDNFSEYDQPTPNGNGSGWVFDEQGHIVTNAHVVANTDKIQVRFTDGTVRQATVVGTDPKSDIAVIKVEAGSLIPASIATDPVHQGEIVFAFGAPFRFENSMSQGIVSATNRSRVGILAGRAGYENFIQTDAAINPGNSGGPLTNIRGQVVGMNTAIATRSSGPGTATFSGLGFAIPADQIVRVVEDLLDDGNVAYGFIGIGMPANDLTPEMAATFGYDGKGVLIENVIAGFPGEKAGLRRGDIVTQVNDIPVSTNDQFRNLVSSFAPGTQITLKVFRDGKYKELPTTLADASDHTLVSRAPNSPAESKNSDTLLKLGIESAVTMSETLAKRFGIEFVPGALVTGVRPGSIAAASAGLEPGSIITDVHGTAITTVGELTAALDQADLGTGVRMSVHEYDKRTRESRDRYVFMQLPESAQ